MVKPKKRDSSESITLYFDELKHLLEQYNILNQPAKILNVEETGISLDHSLDARVLSRRGSNPFSVSADKSSTTTLVAAVSA